MCLGPADQQCCRISCCNWILTEASSIGISYLIVYLDSQLVVCQLNRVYSICDPFLLRLYLRIRRLERLFDYIEYRHIPREFNVIIDSLANYVINWHLTHR
jgi:hypothetical protein